MAHCAVREETMTEDLKPLFQIAQLQNELRRATQSGSVAVAFSAVSIVVSAFLWIQVRNAPPPAISPAPTTAPQSAAALPSAANFQSLTTQSLTVVNSQGNTVATLDGDGLKLAAGSSLLVSNASGDWTSVTSTGELLFSPGAQPSMTPVSPGVISVDTPQQYTVEVGAYNSGPTQVGIGIFNDHNTATGAGSSPLDKTAAVLTPAALALVDSGGTIRASIGQTPLAVC
jgi:hypothetical protein